MAKWVEINGYEGLYEISDDGQCRSVDRIIKDKNKLEKVLKGKVLKPKAQLSGHLSVHLSKDGVPKQYLLHRLVGMHFLDGYFEGACIRHLDGNCNNNRADNLQWGTFSDNSKDMYYRHSKRIGMKSHFSKYSESKINDVLSLKGKCSSNRASEITGVSRRYISTLWAGEAGFQKAEKFSKRHGEQKC